LVDEQNTLLSPGHFFIISDNFPEICFIFDIWKRQNNGEQMNPLKFMEKPFFMM
jgi:hypothetical protein